MTKIFIIVLILFCSFSTFGQYKKPNKTSKKNATTTQSQKKEMPKSRVTDDEYAVFMTILGKDRSDFVVVKEIGGGEIPESEFEHVKSIFDELNIETVKDYAVKNMVAFKETVLIEKKFPTKKNYFLISYKKFFGSKHNWKGFYKNYPKSGGAYSFTRVGFSKDGNQAFVSVVHGYSKLCGEGNYYLLKKENEEWKIIKKRMIWVS